ncbi:MAG: hypothetical protein ACKVP0_23795 [Pirellulaceae bacterium]
MNTSANLFALPIENPKHLQFRDDAWLGGPFFVGRYYLGKFLNTNEYLYGQDEYDAHVRQCLNSRLPMADWLSKSSYLHEFMTTWLKHQYRKTEENQRFPIPDESKEELAIVRIMEVPDVSDEDICRELRCTEKTINRWTDYNLFRREQKRLSFDWTNK